MSLPVSPRAGLGLSPTAVELLSALERGASGWQRTSHLLRGMNAAMNRNEAYATLARMVRLSATRYPLVEGEGNFGDGEEPPVGPEFTSCRLSDVGRATLAGLLPNLLLNGAQASGASLHLGLPHNSTEVFEAALVLAADASVDNQALLERIPGPDFPEGGVVVLNDEMRRAEATGEGTVTVEARVRIEQAGAGAALVVEELPFGVGYHELAAELSDIMARRASPILDIIPGVHAGGTRPTLILPLAFDVEPEAYLAELRQETNLRRRLQVRMEVGGTRSSMPDLLRRHVAARLAAHRRFSHGEDAARERLIHELRSQRNQFGDARRSQLVPPETC